MKIVSSYICEICNCVFSTFEIAAQCEALGFPKDFNKYLGQWFIAPLQVFYNEEKEDSSYIKTKICWRLLRIDKNEIITIWFILLLMF